MVVRVTQDILDFAVLHRVSPVSTALIPRSGAGAVVLRAPIRVCRGALTPQGQLPLVTSMTDPVTDAPARSDDGEVCLSPGEVAFHPITDSFVVQMGDCVDRHRLYPAV